MKKYVITSTCLTTFVLLWAGCATIVQSTKQEISIATEPSGAAVLRDGVPVGTTPLTLTVKRKDAGETLILRKEGYEDGSIETKSRINGWFFGNIVTGGLAGSTTDLISGAAYKYDEDKYFLPLKAKGAASFSNETEIKSYAVINNLQLRIDIAQGEGEALENLIKLAKLEKNKNLINALKNASQKFSDPIEFANSVRNIMIDHSLNG